jgi:hypothetical protein
MINPIQNIKSPKDMLRAPLGDTAADQEDPLDRLYHTKTAPAGATGWAFGGQICSGI